MKTQEALTREQRAEKNHAHCRKCGADIVWMSTHRGKRIPIDYQVAFDEHEVHLEPDGENLGVTPAVPMHECVEQEMTYTCRFCDGAGCGKCGYLGYFATPGLKRILDRLRFGKRRMAIGTCSKCHKRHVLLYAKGSVIKDDLCGLCGSEAMRTYLATGARP